jgi:hypothetical protein
MDGKIGRHMDRKMEWGTYEWAHRHTDKWRDEQIDRQIVGQTLRNGNKFGRTNWKIDRWIYIQTNEYAYILWTDKWTEGQLDV